MRLFVCVYGEQQSGTIVNMYILSLRQRVNFVKMVGVVIAFATQPTFLSYANTHAFAAVASHAPADVPSAVGLHSPPVAASAAPTISVSEVGGIGTISFDPPYETVQDMIDVLIITSFQPGYYFTDQERASPRLVANPDSSPIREGQNVGSVSGYGSQSPVYDQKEALIYKLEELFQSIARLGKVAERPDFGHGAGLYLAPPPRMWFDIARGLSILISAVALLIMLNQQLAMQIVGSHTFIDTQMFVRWFVISLCALYADQLCHSVFTVVARVNTIIYNSVSGEFLVALVNGVIGRSHDVWRTLVTLIAFFVYLAIYLVAIASMLFRYLASDLLTLVAPIFISMLNLPILRSIGGQWVRGYAQISVAAILSTFLFSIVNRSIQGVVADTSEGPMAGWGPIIEMGLAIILGALLAVVNFSLGSSALFALAQAPIRINLSASRAPSQTRVEKMDEHDEPSVIDPPTPSASIDDSAGIDPNTVNRQGTDNRPYTSSDPSPVTSGQPASAATSNTPWYMRSNKRKRRFPSISL